MNKVWAKELFEIDVAERETIMNEMHGIKTKRTIQETPENVQKAVASFRRYIQEKLDNDLDNGDSIVPPATKDP